MGPAGLIVSEEIRIGLLIMGPGLVYPAHRHPAAEWYHVLSGTGQLGQGRQPALPR
ncbi:MAG: dimethylsulfonioproprionate lyase family protein, partial [Candidatus Puniceispirillaceae bacterium]